MIWLRELHGAAARLRTQVNLDRLETTHAKNPQHMHTALRNQLGLAAASAEESYANLAARAAGNVPTAESRSRAANLIAAAEAAYAEN